MKRINLAVKFAIAYISLISMFLILLTIVCNIPSTTIRRNISYSIPLLEREGDRPLMGGDEKNYRLANWTDSLMLNIIYNIDNSKPLESALRDVHFNLIPNKWELISQVDSLKYQIISNDSGNTQYPRYWHGYIVFLRPLLLFSDYEDIRQIYQIIFLLLFALISAFLYKRISIIATCIFGISLALINFSIFPLSLQFSSVFFIAFMFLIIILMYPRINNENAIILFFIIGAITSFMDLLTAPLVTFGLPAIILLVLRSKKPSQELFVNNFIFLLNIGLSWIAGYIILWASKWIIASIVLQENVITDSINQILFRINGETPAQGVGGFELLFGSISRNVKLFFDHSFPLKLLLVYIIPGVFLLAFCRWRKKVLDLSLSVNLFIISLTPYLWYAMASNHSYIHSHFTYRIQIISIMAILFAMWNSLNSQKLVLEISLLKKQFKALVTKKK